MKFISVLIVLLFVSLPLASPAATDDGKAERAVVVDNPGSELWRNVRQRENPLAGTSQVQGTDANFLMRVSGESWRQYRTLTLIPRASIAIFVASFLLFLVWLLRGKLVIKAGRSGIKITLHSKPTCCSLVYRNFVCRAGIDRFGFATWAQAINTIVWL